MGSTIIASASVGLIFAGALLGIKLQRLLPGHHLGKDTQDVVKLSAGMIATLTALVLGLLVSSAKSSFDAVNNGIVQASAKTILLDRALARYGTEAQPARDQVKRSIEATIDVVWPEKKREASALGTIERSKGMELVAEALRELQPTTEAQRDALSQARQIVADLAQIRWVLIEQQHQQLPLPLLLILVFWLVLLFASFGLFAPQNATALTVLFIGACAVSAAVFLVIEMSQPVDGLIKISSSPLQNALQHLGE